MSTGVIIDAGVSDSFGNEYLYNSGAICRIEDISKGLSPRFDSDWINYFVKSNGQNSKDLFDVIEEAVVKHSKNDVPLNEIEQVQVIDFDKEFSLTSQSRFRLNYILLCLKMKMIFAQVEKISIFGKIREYSRKMIR